MVHRRQDCAAKRYLQISGPCGLQGVFKNMQTMLTTLQQSLAASGGSRASGVVETKLKAAISALVGQFTEMQSVLDTPTHEFSAIDTFLVRSVSHFRIRRKVAEVQDVIKRVCCSLLFLYQKYPTSSSLLH